MIRTKRISIGTSTISDDPHNVQFHWEDTSERFQIPGIETVLSEYVRRYDDKSKAVSIWESVYIRCGTCWRGWREWKQANTIESLGGWDSWLVEADKIIDQKRWSINRKPAT